MSALSRLNKNDSNPIAEKIVIIAVFLAIILSIVGVLFWQATAELEPAVARNHLQDLGYTQISIDGKRDSQCRTGRYRRLSRVFTGISIEGYRTAGVVCSSFGQTDFQVIVTAQRR